MGLSIKYVGRKRGGVYPQKIQKWTVGEGFFMLGICDLLLGLTLNKKQLLDETFVTSTTYKVQSQYSETINLENKSVDSLLENTYRELLLKLTQNIIAQ